MTDLQNIVTMLDYRNIDYTKTHNVFENKETTVIALIKQKVEFLFDSIGRFLHIQNKK